MIKLKHILEKKNTSSKMKNLGIATTLMKDLLDTKIFQDYRKVGMYDDPSKRDFWVGFAIYALKRRAIK